MSRAPRAQRGRAEAVVPEVTAEKERLRRIGRSANSRAPNTSRARSTTPKCCPDDGGAAAALTCGVACAYRLPLRERSQRRQL
jgi:hypothetical protein